MENIYLIPMRNARIYDIYVYMIYTYIRIYDIYVSTFI